MFQISKDIKYILPNKQRQKKPFGPLVLSIPFHTTCCAQTERTTDFRAPAVSLSSRRLNGGVRPVRT
eukprot:1624530-Prorocentrum_lima.AAC.1